MEEEFELRHFDSPALSFVASHDEDGVWVVRVTDRGPARPPLGLEPTDEGLLRWLETRALPFNRTYADKVCLQMGIAPGDVSRVIEVGRGLSLNDCFWVVPSGFDGRFEDYNLYENGFSDALALVAYTGKVSVGDIPVRGLTPELTTNGSLPKAWRVGPDGERLLYKGSTPGFHPGEWLSECLVYAVERVAGIRATPYWHERWGGADCSVCPCFCDLASSYVPFSVAAGSSRLGAAVACAFQIGAGAFEDLADMLVLDCLVANVDRHMTNFGFSVDARTGEVMGMAPVFDNGRALFPNLGDEQVRDAAAVASLSRPAVGAPTFDAQAGRFMGERQLGWLARVEGADLAGAFLEAAPGMSEARARGLAGFLRERAGRMLQIPPVGRDELADAAARAFPQAARVVGPAPTAGRAALLGEGACRGDARDDEWER